MSDEEKPIIFVDTELYANASLFRARKWRKSGGPPEVWNYWITRQFENQEEIAAVMRMDAVFVTFNGEHFDKIIIAMMIQGRLPVEMKNAGTAIIVQELKSWDAADKFQVRMMPVEFIDHIDLIEVAPLINGLKMYGARLGARRLKENPVHHESCITSSQMPEAEDYCNNDLDLTELLFEDLQQPLLLRHEMSNKYGVDMRSKSDAQMAEIMFVKRLGLKRGRRKVPPYVKYVPPAWAKFRSNELNALVEQMKEKDWFIKADGHPVQPDFLGFVETRTGRFKMGVGGLHSVHDKHVCHVAGDGWVIVDIDVASYYPTLIINSGVVPATLGRAFIEEYTLVYMTRLAAKKLWLETGSLKAKSDADTLRIFLNGTFGKLLSMWSALYAPDLGLYTVLTGQLGLLRTIEEIEEHGGIVLSSNTDGVMIKCRERDEKLVRDAINAFAVEAMLEFEFTPYRCVALKDVNNYIAVKDNRKTKGKGLYAEQDIRKNPASSICTRAVSEWLSHGTPLETTIRSGKLLEYLSARNVNLGGALQGDKFIGKVVRWYKSNDPNCLPFTSVAKGARIPKTDGCKAMMELPPDLALPADLDYSAYLREAIMIAKDIGAEEFLTDEERDLLPTKKTRSKKHAAT